MEIQVKNVKHLAALSEETLCFSCTVYADGKRIALAENRGHGGETDIRALNGGWQSPEITKAREYVDTLPEVETDWNDPKNPDKKFTYKQSLEGIVDDLVADWLTERDVKRMLNNKWLFTIDGKAGLFQIPKRKKNPKDHEQVCAHLLNKYDGKAKLLNARLLEDAVRIYKAAA